jgi:hypothetical protein
LVCSTFFYLHFYVEEETGGPKINTWYSLGQFSRRNSGDNARTEDQEHRMNNFKEAYTLKRRSPEIDVFLKA